MVDSDGQKIVTLPPKHIETVWLNLSDRERKFYKALYSRSKLEFDGFVESGSVLNKYAAILTLLLRLRQACVHPFLVLGRSSVEELNSTQPQSSTPSNGLTMSIINRLYKRFIASHDQEKGATVKSKHHLSTAAATLPAHVQELLQTLEREGTSKQECPVCLDEPESPAVTPCAHLMCYDCLISSMNYYRYVVWQQLNAFLIAFVVAPRSALSVVNLSTRQMLSSSVGDEQI